MSDDPCRKFLTEAGFKDIEAEEIINNLSNQSNLDIIKEIKTASDAEELLKTSNEISKRRSIQSITALNDGLTNNQVWIMGAIDFEYNPLSQGEFKC